MGGGERGKGGRKTQMGGGGKGQGGGHRFVDGPLVGGWCFSLIRGHHRGVFGWGGGGGDGGFLFGRGGRSGGLGAAGGLSGPKKRVWGSGRGGFRGAAGHTGGGPGGRGAAADFLRHAAMGGTFCDLGVGGAFATKPQIPRGRPLRREAGWNGGRHRGGGTRNGRGAGATVVFLYFGVLLVLSFFSVVCLVFGFALALGGGGGAEIPGGPKRGERQGGGGEPPGFFLPAPRGARGGEKPR